jgi:hypothetical protein
MSQTRMPSHHGDAATTNASPNTEISTLKNNENEDLLAVVSSRFTPSTLISRRQSQTCDALDASSETPCAGSVRERGKEEVAPLRKETQFLTPKAARGPEPPLEETGMFADPKQDEPGKINDRNAVQQYAPIDGISLLHPDPEPTIAEEIARIMNAGRRS